MSNFVMIACPPYPQYQTAPEDQPNSELRDCPKCKGKMWLSGKKRGLLMFHAVLKDEIFLACYDCVTKFAKENRGFFDDAEMMKI